MILLPHYCPKGCETAHTNLSLLLSRSDNTEGLLLRNVVYAGNNIGLQLIHRKRKRR